MSGFSLRSQFSDPVTTYTACVLSLSSFGITVMNESNAPRQGQMLYLQNISHPTLRSSHYCCRVSGWRESTKASASNQQWQPIRNTCMPTYSGVTMVTWAYHAMQAVRQQCSEHANTSIWFTCWSFFPLSPSAITPKLPVILGGCKAHEGRQQAGFTALSVHTFSSTGIQWKSTLQQFHFLEIELFSHKQSEWQTAGWLPRSQGWVHHNHKIAVHYLLDKIKILKIKINKCIKPEDGDVNVTMTCNAPEYLPTTKHNSCSIWPLFGSFSESDKSSITHQQLLLTSGSQDKQIIFGAIWNHPTHFSCSKHEATCRQACFRASVGCFLHFTLSFFTWMEAYL